MPTLSYLIFATTLVFAPVAFGAVDLPSIALIELLVPTSLLLLIAATRFNKEQIWVKTPGLLPLLLLLGYMALQLLPLPPAIIKLISPHTFNLYRHVAENNAAIWIPISINPQATLTEFFRFATYTMFYLLAVQLMAKFDFLKKALLLIAILAGVLAFEAIIQKYSSPGHIYWFRPTVANATTTGPWVYHNHFAGFMEMLLPLVLGLFIYYRPNFTYKMPLKDRIVSLFTIPQANLHIMLGIGAILIYTSIFVSLSRGGIISASLSLVLFLILLGRGQKHSSKTKYLLTTLLVAILAVGWFGWEPIFARFDLIANAEGELREARPLLWQDSWRLIKDFPLTGTGFGTFIYSYPAYRTISGRSIFDHAHNDYFELMTDGGIIGFALVGIFLTTILYRAYQTFITRRDRFSGLLSIGALCGIVALLIHSITDFNMYNNANGLYFFFLCALLVSAVNTRQHGRRRKTLLPAGNKNKLLLHYGLPCLLALIACFYFNQGRIIGNYNYAQIKDIYLNINIPAEKLDQISKQAHKAVAAAPLEAGYHFALANIAAFTNDHDTALNHYRQAIRLNPVEGDHLGQYALYLSQSNPTRTEQLLKAADRLDPLNPLPLRTYGNFLLAQGNKKQALDKLQAALAIDPSRSKEYLALLFFYNLPPDDIAQILPKRVAAYLAYGDSLLSLGKKDKAMEYYLLALTFMDNEPKINRWFFTKVFGMLIKEKRYEEALRVATMGADLLPTDALLKIYSGDAYIKLGINYRGIEEYKLALLLEPTNQQAQQRLEQLAVAEKDQ
ncbi:MAG: O-antigen ligase family protein [Desulfobulbaceae bacterium]|nr:O-antigen ligase family protein [Desulfobulbaceae bacterium]